MRVHGEERVLGGCIQKHSPLQVDLSPGHFSAVLCNRGGGQVWHHTFSIVLCNTDGCRAWQLAPTTHLPGNSTACWRHRGGTYRGREHAPWHNFRIC